jgi:hypothetical protein
MSTYTPTNRERSRKPKGTQFWCEACDGFYGSAGKCPRCRCKSTLKCKDRIRDARAPEE